MTDRDSFIAAIKAAPDDDIPRLVFADWLDDNGNGDLDRATAEFIRLSCDMSNKKRKAAAAYEWLYSHEYIPLAKVFGESPEQAVLRGIFRDGPSYRVKCENWKRLLPSFVALFAPHEASPHEMEVRRSGRHVRVRGHFVVGDVILPPRFSFKFERGFLEDFTLAYPSTLEAVAPAIAADQPLCRRAQQGVEQGNRRKLEAMVMEMILRAAGATT